MNHTRFPKEDHLPDWARRDNHVKKGDRIDSWQSVAKQTSQQIREGDVMKNYNLQVI